MRESLWWLGRWGAPLRQVPTWVAILTALALSTPLTLAGCGSGDRLLKEADPGAAPEEPTYEQASSIIQRECTPCHREGRTGPRYDSCDEILRNLRDLSSVVFDSNTMPPGAWPRLSSEERLTLERWIDQGSVAPCN